MPNGRARSFTTETPSANSAPVVYTWSNLRPGTFIYQSGTHPSVQVQMGLYGAVRKDAAPGQTYPGVPFSSEATLLYSEVDPALHDAVATGNYGAGNAMPSTVGYEPKYFLINGLFYTSGLLPIYAGKPGETIVLHFLNAGLHTHVPIVNGTYLRLIAEDGFPYPYPKEQYTACLPAGKTLDALFTPGTNGMLAVYDRRLNMMNGASSPGGMLAYLNVAESPGLTDVPADWVVTYFGQGPVYPPSTIGPMDDPDGDGVSNLNEYISGTNPNNPLSFLRITALSPPVPLAGTVLTYGDTAAGRSYNVQSTTNLVTGPWTTIIENVPGTPSVMTFTDTRPTAATSFYRIQIAYP
jgi:FtsP/CotA-like multicopper oxidase with cupredoxin domain